MSTQRLHLIVTGKVQGVYFRAWTRDTGERLGLRGWVRNLADGSVEVLAEGEEALLQTFLAASRRGPEAAQVEDVQSAWSAAENQFTDFKILR